MIRTTKHSIKFCNNGKVEKLNIFLDECLRVAQVYLDYLWDNKISWFIKNKSYTMDIQRDLLEHPSMLSNVEVENQIKDFKSTLTARARKCVLTQVCGIIGASLEKQRKRLFIFEKLCNDNIYNEMLYNRIQVNKPTKPNIENTNFEFNSICADFKPIKSKEFNGYLQLKSIGETFGVIRIPIKFHRRNKKYADWQMKPSFLIGREYVDIRWEREIPPLKTEGITVGCDQGLKTIATFSDKQTTPNADKHGHTLDSIINKMARKRKGSQAFQAAQAHRKNFIKHSINQLNFREIKQINLEEIKNIGHKNPTNRKLSHWTNTIIRDTIIDRCEIMGVAIKQQSSTYRSQRCSCCGLVRKSNRKGKEYFCSNCGLDIDADYNASLNHEIELPDVPQKLRDLNLNRAGFYWRNTGFYDLGGVELTVPLAPTKK